MSASATTVPIYPFEPRGVSAEAADDLGLHLGDFSACLEVRGRRRRHRHDHFEIFWIPRGRGVHTNDFKSYVIAPGTLIFVSPGQMHGWDVHAATTGRTISFTRDFFLPDTEGQRLLLALPFFFPASCSPVLHVPAAERPGIAARVSQLESEFAASQLSRATMLRSCLQILLVEAQRLYARVHEGTTPARARAGAELTRRLHLLVETHFAELEAVGDLARLLGVSVGHLRDTVKQQTGRTVGDLIRERRQLEARRLLAHTDLTIAEIAYRVGFEDASYFGRVFRRRENQSPGRFRGRFRAESQNPS